MQSMHSEFTLVHIAAMSGLKPRTVQNLAAAGALRANAGTDREGTGVRRRFCLEEVIIAAFLAPLSNLQMSIGTLLQVAGNIRGHMGIFLPKFKAAMNHKTRDVLLIHWSGPDEDGDMIITGCTVESAPHLAKPDEVTFEIPLHSALAGLRRLR
jgi:hypothetical protein